MLYTDEHPSHLLGLSVVRQWETNDDGFAMRFTLTADKNGSGVRVGGFGMSLVPDCGWGGLDLDQIGQTLSFLEPAIASEHGYAVWNRIDGTRSLVVTPLAGTQTSFEAYRPVLEDGAHVQCGTYEWSAKTAAWDAEWRQNKQARGKRTYCVYINEIVIRLSLY